MTIWPKTWLARIPWALALVFLAYSAAAYFGTPAALRYLAQNQAAAALHRPVTIGDITFNPYTLRLAVADLQVGGRSSSEPFITIDHVKLRLSWTSLSHLALVVKELTVERPAIRVARLDQRTFDFSDLLESFTQESRPNNAPLSFAISNIEVNDGLILFDDRVLNRKHRLEDIRLAIPFIANLPTDADIYVRPMLQMRVDGCAFNITGKTKLFRGNLESAADISFQKLDITPFADYLAAELPFKLEQAELSAALQVNFIQAAGRPQLQMAGAVTLDDVALSDRRASPLAKLKQLRAAIAQFDPLAGELHLSSIGIDSPSSHLVINHDGTTNLAALLGGHWVQPPPSSQTNGPKHIVTRPQPPHSPKVSLSAPPPRLLNPMAAAPSNAVSGVPAPSGGLGKNTSVTAEPHFSLSMDSLELNSGAVDITDRSGPAPLAVQLQAIHLGLKHFTTVGGTPISYNFSTSLKTGGTLTGEGSFNLLSSRATATLTLAKIDLPPLQNLMTRILPAIIVSGKISAQAKLQATLGRHFNVHAEPSRITLDAVELRPPEQAQSIIGWKRLIADLGQFDLASHQAAVRELRCDGLHLAALRDSHGNLNLASLLIVQPRVREEVRQIAAASSAKWQYRIESVVLENADAAFEDDTQPQPFSLRIAPLNVRLNGMTNDFAKPFTLEADGNMARRGTFKIAGETAINPLQCRVHISGERIDLASLEPFITNAIAAGKLNAKISNAMLALNGDAQTQLRDGKFDAGYQGSVTLANVRLLDKLTGDSFLRWYALKVDGLVIQYGPTTPRIQIGAMALSDFYVRLILNADGRLNLRDIVTGPAQPAVSITQPTVRPSSKTPAPALPADITVGSLGLQNGEVNYLDNFIKPNYSAVVTQLDGKVGAFGTKSTNAAEVLLAGNVNGTSPVSISGSINPLAPMASLDLQANASKIQLPPLTPYVAKYTGYPITGGTLAGNVHYILANRRLTATNNLILDQLSFGDRVENTSASNLPVRLAVAVLKDSEGRIYLSIPVSGSLTDPNFDLGSLIWQGLLNVIMKAATSPFTVLASALGGGQRNLSYVEFAPGYSTLTALERDKLATLAVLLEQRPWLKLQISGRVDPGVDREGLREALLEDEIKRRKAEDEHQKVEEVEITPDEYNRYLRRVYRAADFAKPRGFIGMVKRLPPDEMRKLLLANIKVTDEDLNHLAEARAAAVYQVLSARIAPSRLLVGPPKLNPEGITEGATPRVDFSLK